MTTAPFTAAPSMDPTADPMQLALDLATHAIGLSEPNPRVGCVLVGRSGQRIGQGHTQQAGGPHAEVMALRAAREAGHDPRGATAYVTLEPCSHHGRTPPCCEALAEAGIAHVVTALTDPNPQVAGRGLARLREAGMTVDLLDPADPRAVAARELNIGFFSRMLHARPWVRMKVAASLDGRTALDNGASQWITGPAARTDGHAWRRRAGAVLTGIGTVRDDDPRLDVRLVETARQPLRVVVDARLDIAPSARILQAPGAARIYCALDPADAAVRPRAEALTATGATLAAHPDANGKVDLEAMLDDLATLGINELHVEAGHKLNGSLLRAGLVDELLIYLAPMLLGPGRGIAHLGPLERLSDGLALAFHGIERIGDDLRLIARPAGRAAF